LPGFILGRELSCARDGFGSRLSRDQALKCERLFDSESRELVSGLRGFERAGRIARTAQSVAQ
jgi:hypothetical protein